MLKLYPILFLLIKSHPVPNRKLLLIRPWVVQICSRLYKTLMKRLSRDVSLLSSFFQNLDFRVVRAFRLERRTLNSDGICFSTLILNGFGLIYCEQRVCFWNGDIRKLLFNARSVDLWGVRIVQILVNISAWLKLTLLFCHLSSTLLP